MTTLLKKTKFKLSKVVFQYTEKSEYRNEYIERDWFYISKNDGYLPNELDFYVYFKIDCLTFETKFDISLNNWRFDGLTESETKAILLKRFKPHLQSRANSYILDLKNQPPRVISEEEDDDDEEIPF